MKKLLVALTLFAASAVYANDQEVINNEAPSEKQDVVKKHVTTNPEESTVTENVSEEIATEKIAANSEEN